MSFGKRAAALLLALAVSFGCFSSPALALTEDDGTRTVRIEFTHDIHSFLGITEASVFGTRRERGGIARLKTLLDVCSSACGKEDTIYVDAGDFSQGTLYQAGYENGAYELSSLSLLGCAATTPGNHEWDHGGNGFANMLRSAAERNDRLAPMLVSNVDFSGELTEEQANVKSALEGYAEKSGQDAVEYTVVETGNGLKIGLFGVAGPGSIEDSPTSGMKWIDYIEAAGSMAEILKDKCDIIICLSHSGNSGGAYGDDFELAKAVPEIDMIVSGHSHSFIFNKTLCGETLIASSGEYLDYMGYADISVLPDGTKEFGSYELVPIDRETEENIAFRSYAQGFRASIERDYLSRFGYKGYDEIISFSGFDFMTLNDMYSCHQEYPLGNLIADSYIYEAEKNGITDIDVAVVGLGTIRESITRGPVKLSDAFAICSLGVGSDGSAGHPLVAAYVTGKELKLLVELDASLGPMTSSIKMSYSGLKYTFNTERILLDRTTQISLSDGSKIEDGKLYKVCCNMYAANMLGMVNSLTKGILSIVPKDADGNPFEDFYDAALKTADGEEIKEWAAFADYLSSFEKGGSGYPEIPERYMEAEGRKVKISEGGLSRISNPGPIMRSVILIIAAVILVTAAAVILIVRSVRRRKRAGNA